MRDDINAIHINFTLSFIFHIQAKTLKLNHVKMVKIEKIAHQDNNTPEKTNLFHNNVSAVSGHNGIKKQRSRNTAQVKYV